MLATAVNARAAGEPEPPQAARASKPLTITFYPILVRAPLFGARIDAPAIGNGGGESGDQSGATDVSLNAAYMTGVEVEADRWFGEFNALWAAVSAHHTLPHTSVDSDIYFLNGRAGVRLYRGLSATAGFRRVSTKLDVELTPTGTATTLQGATHPGVWDPLIGVDLRGPVGKSWSIDIDFQGGGFGVGSDLDLSGDLYADWRFARHFSLRTGYTVVHFKLTIDDVRLGSFERTLVATQTLHGPAIGFGVVF